jgi:hypothetical protein
VKSEKSQKVYSEMIKQAFPAEILPKIEFKVLGELIKA